MFIEPLDTLSHLANVPPLASTSTRPVYTTNPSSYTPSVRSFNSTRTYRSTGSLPSDPASFALNPTLTKDTKSFRSLDDNHLRSKGKKTFLPPHSLNLSPPSAPPRTSSLSKIKGSRSPSQGTVSDQSSNEEPLTVPKPRPENVDIRRPRVEAIDTIQLEPPTPTKANPFYPVPPPLSHENLSVNVTHGPKPFEFYRPSHSRNTSSASSVVSSSASGVSPILRSSGHFRDLPFSTASLTSLDSWSPRSSMSITSVSSYDTSSNWSFPATGSANQSHSSNSPYANSRNRFLPLSSHEPHPFTNPSPVPQWIPSIGTTGSEHRSKIKKFSTPIEPTPLTASSRSVHSLINVRSQPPPGPPPDRPLPPPPLSPEVFDLPNSFSHESNLPLRSSPSGGAGRYVCQYCQKRFSRPSSLRIHSFSHTGEKPFNCQICGRNFSVQSNLRRHLKVHQRSGNSVNVSYLMNHSRRETEEDEDEEEDEMLTGGLSLPENILEEKGMAMEVG